MGSLLTTLVNLLNATEEIKNNRYIEASFGVGSGRLAKVPSGLHSSIQERRSTTQHGVYVVLLFREDRTGVYLTFNQGVTEPLERLGYIEGNNFIRKRVNELRPRCDYLARFGFSLNDNIDLRSPGGRGEQYEKSTIAHKFYEAGAFPTDKDFLSDLEAILKNYDVYVLSKRDSASASQFYWIFQGNPEHFDIDTYFKSRNEITWTVRQSKNQISEGDRVLFWRSGTSGGVIAQGVVTSTPSEKLFDDAPELWKSTTPRQNVELRCKLRIVTKFVDSPIPREVIRGVH